MNFPDFSLRPPPSLKLDRRGLRAKIEKLKKVTKNWDSRQTLDSPDLVAQLRERVRNGYLSGEMFEHFTAVRRRESLLLSLYLNDLKDPEEAAKIPPVDKDVIKSILGHDPKRVRKHIRRRATQLYFTHYSVERIPALSALAGFLKAAWRAEKIDEFSDPASREWHEEASVIFHEDAPEKVAEFWDGQWTVDQLADQLCIHKDGLFREKLVEAILLQRLKTAPARTLEKDLQVSIREAKGQLLSSGRCLGAKAVQILISRAREEFQSCLPNAWREQIITFSCDPRVPNAGEQARWWGWASKAEKDIAIRALSELTLQQFIKLLESSLKGTAKAHQFDERKRMLLKLFELGKVMEARLSVPQSLYDRMDRKTRGVIRPSVIRGGYNQTSFVCLRCKNDLFLIEGTHDFGLRGFVGDNSFPIKEFWSWGKRSYDDSDFRVNRNDCDIYQSHNGNWVILFYKQLRRLRIEWRGLDKI